jgi:hypothetical protein
LEKRRIEMGKCTVIVDLEVGQVAWYWHRYNYEACWFPVKVICWSGSIGMGELYYVDPVSREYTCVSENCPNGPKCLTPEEVSKLIDINVVANSEDC